MSDLPSSSRPPQRILVRGVNWLGDAVMTTPALLRLREAWPRAHIALLTPAKLADLWRHHLAVDAVLSFAASESLWQVARRLQQGSFDLALVLPNSPRSALEVFLARIPQRVGYARPWRNWLLTRRLPPRTGEVKMRKRPVTEIRRLIAGSSAFAPVGRSASLPIAAHHIHQYLHLAAAVGANPEPLPPRLEVTDDEVRRARSLWPQFPTEPAYWLGLNPGAEYGPAKRWPAARFVAAATALHRQTKCGWLVFGGPKDQALAQQVEAELQRAGLPHVVNLAGRTTLRELCAAFRLCRVVVTNDSGPMHVAAAVGTPVVALFGSTAAELTGPDLPDSPEHRVVRMNVPCSPCFRRQCPIDFRCMERITVERLTAIVLEVLG